MTKSPIYRLEFHNLSPQPVRGTYADAPLTAKGKRLIQTLHQYQSKAIDSGFIGEDVSNDAPCYHYHLVINILQLAQNPKKQLENLLLTTNRAFQEIGFESSEIPHSSNLKLVYEKRINGISDVAFRIDGDLSLPRDKEAIVKPFSMLFYHLIHSLSVHNREMELAGKRIKKEKAVVEKFLQIT